MMLASKALLSHRRGILAASRNPDPTHEPVPDRVRQSVAAVVAATALKPLSRPRLRTYPLQDQDRVVMLMIHLKIGACLNLSY